MSQLDRVADLLAARYRAQSAELQRLNAKEARIRAALRSLSAKSELQEMLPHHVFHASGGYRSWTLFVAQTRSRLMAELAQIRSAQTRQIARLKSAFGETEAIDGLCKDQRAARHGALRKRRQQELLALSLLRGPDQTS